MIVVGGAGFTRHIVLGQAGAAHGASDYYVLKDIGYQKGSLFRQGHLLGNRAGVDFDAFSVKDPSHKDGLCAQALVRESGISLGHF